MYCHTNKLNGKQYIGITSQNPPYKRWRYGHGYIGSDAFYKAITKYTWNGFTHEILFNCLTQEEAEQYEIEMIILLNTRVPNGYNIAHGGNTCGTHSDETKLKISNGNKGKILSDETKRKISKSKTGRKINRTTKRFGEESSFYGKNHTEETKRKIGELASERYQGSNNPRALKVDQYNLDGTYIRTWDYIKQVKDELDICKVSISKCCKGSRKTAGGFIWRYNDEN